MSALSDIMTRKKNRWKTTGARRRNTEVGGRTTKDRRRTTDDGGKKTQISCGLSNVIKQTSGAYLQVMSHKPAASYRRRSAVYSYVFDKL